MPGKLVFQDFYLSVVLMSEAIGGHKPTNTGGELHNPAMKIWRPLKFDVDIPDCRAIHVDYSQFLHVYIFDGHLMIFSNMFYCFRPFGPTKFEKTSWLRFPEKKLRVISRGWFLCPCLGIGFTSPKQIPVGDYIPCLVG